MCFSKSETSPEQCLQRLGRIVTGEGLLILFPPLFEMAELDRSTAALALLELELALELRLGAALEVVVGIGVIR
jgi:hypothetical protein